MAERWRPVPRPVPHAGRAARPRRSPRSSGGGPGSATTAGRSTCTARAMAVVERPRRPPARRSSTRCSRCRASGRTPPGRCWPSPSSATTASSTPTRRGCWRAGRARASARRRSQAAADAAVPAGRGVGVEPGHARPRRDRCARAGAPRCDDVPGRRTRARGLARAGPRPTPPTGSAGVSRRPVALRGQRPPGPRPPRRGAAHGRGGRPRTWPWRWAGPTTPSRAAAGRRDAASPTASSPPRPARTAWPSGAQPVTKSTIEPVDLVRLLDVEEVAGAVDDLQPRALAT